MATPTREQDLIALLSDLVHLDYDAIDAYDVAIDRLEDPTATTKLREFRADHERHIRELGDCIVSFGGEPPKKGDYRRILTQGKVYLASLSGTNAILKAMKSNEDDTNAAYERAVAECRPGDHARVCEVLERGLQDERRHRAWLESQIH